MDDNFTLNLLPDFTSIHAKFLGPLPSNVDDFNSSLSSAFPNIVDLSQLMKEISPLSNISNLPTAMSSLNRFFAPVDVEVANQGQSSLSKLLNSASYGSLGEWILTFNLLLLLGCPVKSNEVHQSHGQNAVILSQLFAKLRTIKKSDLSTLQSNEDCQGLASDDKNVKVWSKNNRGVSSENLVFIWGLMKKITASKLKKVLRTSHPVFAQEFDVKYLDKSCAIVVFWESGLSETFISDVNNEEKLDGSLREMVAEGLRASGYETYKRACRLGFWEAELADSLDKSLESSDMDLDLDTEASEIDWSSEFAINFDEL